ncbi:MAG: diguanylate cyclase [Anaerovoracaceae bacterium]|jgi:diguanylate cyclase (GGDEF)-like protein
MSDYGGGRNRGYCKFRDTLFQNPLIAGGGFHRTVTAVLVVLLCAVISYLFISSNDQMSKIYQEETRDSIVEIKKIFLKATVNNLIMDLETDQNRMKNHYKSAIDQRYEVFSKRKFDGGFVSGIKSDLGMDTLREGETSRWVVFIWNNDNKVLYDSADLFSQDISITIENIKPALSHYRILHHGDKSCLFGISQEYIDDEIKEAVATKIKRLSFGNDSYIWVNEVLNYDGGENYAIRRIHPNLPETEGMFLSTDMADIKGNLPYLTELEGVKRDGELFFSYHFKELNSDRISEKLTYAKLYKEYDWIIAMGIQNNEMERYISKTNGVSKAESLHNSLKFLGLLLTMVLFFIAVIIIVEQWRLKRSRKRLESALQYDTLTNAKSRRFGEEYLGKLFIEFHSGILKTEVAIMLFDIDNFKSINDRYGHHIGDLVLREFVSTVYKTIRDSDELFRWGGDEFVGVFRGLNKENTVILAEKILENLSSLELEGDEGEQIQIGISIGATNFEDGDKSFIEAIKRADKAMYLSKAEGGGLVSQL